MPWLPCNFLKKIGLANWETIHVGQKAANI